MSSSSDLDRATNLDPKVVDAFGEEWSRFDQRGMDDAERDMQARGYFAVFPWDKLAADAVGFDLGCGSGRWARYVAPRVGKLHCIDASPAALEVARRNLADVRNVEIYEASVSDIPLPDASQDFGYCLGVLHHVPDTVAGLREAVSKLKPGAPFLVYLYYAFDNRPAWFRSLWQASDVFRRAISSLPSAPRHAVSEVIATLVYFPLARGAKLIEKTGANVSNMPLSAYRNRSFYSMRTDALDRFGTRLEQRFTRSQIERMMRDAGLRDIVFSDDVPFWCAVGTKV